MLLQETWSFTNAPYRRDRVVMKILAHISRFVLGMIFAVFGPNGFLHFAAGTMCALGIGK